MSVELQANDRAWFAGVLHDDPAATVVAADVHLHDDLQNVVAETARGDMHMIELPSFEPTQENSDLIESTILAAFAVQAAVSRALAGEPC